MTLPTEKSFGQGQEDDVSLIAWCSFKLPRKIAGSRDTSHCVRRREPSVGTSRLGRRRTVPHCNGGTGIERFAAHHHLRRLDTERASSVAASWCSYVPSG